MDFQKVIDNRHSIRDFEKKKVPRKIIEKLILNATKAPSAKNAQNYFFYVVDNNMGKVYKILQEIAVKNKFDFSKFEPKIREAAERFYTNLGNAPCVIFVFREKKDDAPAYQDANDISGISAAIENLLLSAVNEGLGACWIGTFYGERKIYELVGAKKNQELISSIALGYSKKGSKVLLRDKKKLKDVFKFV